MPMGAIEGLFLEEEADLTLRYILLDKAFKWVKKRGIKHLLKIGMSKKHLFY